MFGRLESDSRGPRVSRTRAFASIGALILLTSVACDQPTTAPEVMPSPRHSPALTVTPGTLAVYTDRDAWLAAVAAEGATAQEYDYTGLTLGRITARSVDYGPFRIAVDVFSSSTFSNPGIDIISDASCSLGTGDCNRMIFNMIDPSFGLTPPFDMPRVDSLVMPQPIVAFAANFAQTGIAVGCGAGCPTPTGPVTIHFGSATYVLNDGVPTGYGFLGFIAGTPSNTVSFTFAKTGTWANELIEVYRPEFANATATPPEETPSELIGDLSTYVSGSSMPKGNAQSINSKLQLALGAISADQTGAACSYLQDVVNYTKAQSGKKIPAAVANEVISQTNAIRTELGC